MKIIFKSLVVSLVLITSAGFLHGQFGIGLTVTNDIYNRYGNPKDSIAHNGNGSVILNLGVGPKIWFGGEKMSASLETYANVGLFGLALPDYKGLGNISFPLIAKLNFGGLSGLNKEGRTGFSVGGGLQWNKTELYYLSNDFENRGVDRGFYRTYVVQAGYGFGLTGFGIQFFTRYGWNPDVEGGNSLNIGLQFDFNALKLSKIDDPASQL
jgi:hypothetical protein